MSSLAPSAKAPSMPNVTLRPVLIAGLLIVSFWIVVAVTIDFWTVYDPLKLVARKLQSPSLQHWLGTDALGRDVMTRTLYGARYSIAISIIVVACSVAIGSLLGAIAGFFGGWTDGALMRLVDVTLSFPPVLLAMAVAASLGPGLQNTAIAVIAVWWPVYARLMRGQVLDVISRDHIEAARAGGASSFRLLTKHILPLSWTPTIISATMDFGQVVLLAASLSFIGLGAQPPSPEWGSMISDGAAHFYSWWIAFGPGIAILSLGMGFNFIGDALRDILDPREP
ncbi:ABC transporter permease [Mesorhizobium sp.]|uniref:ABC transporter permease n=2 Tax=Mesorhizobium sp. TaxID=1871066 RepID=UPI000FE9565C|nr:MAG: ABC transporter permease [Mesorhizobium sp.]RWK69962.1 MAG: ABC transporter permease [Mesorhizobium sp.]RWK77202.1 MAG: ABC transporter permease [Mesorhizobium sp.]RWK80353.1 MAG: ABC transporter permease [Mesorhizobium sp.]RWL01467.1 MAG: ABC transporter permease [Mesorhizobium sp.]